MVAYIVQPLATAILTNANAALKFQSVERSHTVIGSYNRKFSNNEIRCI